MTRKWRKLCLEEQLFLAGLFVPFLGLAVGWGYPLVSSLLPSFMRGCIWDKWFGVYCLGCGGTRAFFALIRGHFLRALWYHPLVFYGAVIYALFMGSHGMAFLTRGKIRGMTFHSGYLYAALVILVVNCILKNVLRQAFGILLD